jgi:hypothetical protein
MELDASLALYARGKEEWNRWAAQMRERRRALVAAGEWAWSVDSRADPYPTNEATGAWWREAAAQFSYHEFADAADFSGFEFPGVALFVSATLARGGRFRAARFYDGACFNFARFDATAEFSEAQFCSHGSFFETQFLDEAWFEQCRFVAGEFEPTEGGRLDCSNAKFAMPANFAGIGCRAAVFSEAEFTQTVNFDGASFDEMVFLYNTVFRGQVLVRGTRFPYEVDWSDATIAAPPIR